MNATSLLPGLRPKTGLPVLIAVGLVSLSLHGPTSGAAMNQTAQPQYDCGWIGVRVSPMTAAFADSLGMAVPYGAIFDQPEAGGPAAGAGIQAGDVVTAIEGSPLMKSDDFATTIAAMSPGTIVHLSTWRDGQPMEVSVVLAAGKCGG